MKNTVRQDLRTFYDLDAKARNEGSVQDWKLPLREGFLRLITEEKKNALLEIGAGAGKDARFFADHGLRVAAVDLSAEMVRLCRQKDIEAHELDFMSVSRLDKRFDCIWSMNSLLHVEKRELPSVLRELDSVLNPGGLFFMGVYGGEDKEEAKWDEGYPVPRFFFLFLRPNAQRAALAAFSCSPF